MTDRPPPADPTLRAAPRRPGRPGGDPAGKRALFVAPGHAPDDRAAPRPALGAGATVTSSAQDALAAIPTSPPALEPVPPAVAPLLPAAHPAGGPTERVESTQRSAEQPDAARRSDVDHWGRSEHMRELTRRLYDPLYRHWFRAEWEGLEHVPPEGGALLVANHAGAIPSDAPVIMHGIETELGRPVYGLAEHLFKALPVVGTLWARSGGVAAHPDNAYRLLHDEQQLALVFPEGTKGTGKHFSDRYKLARFGRGGFVEIAMRSGVPIVPIAVVGAEESMPIIWQSRRLAKVLGLPYVPITANMLVFGPLGMALYFPSKFRLRVLPPVTFNDPPDQERYSRARVMEASERIRRQIQDALYDMLRKRRSVWFG